MVKRRACLNFSQRDWFVSKSDMRIRMSAASQQSEAAYVSGVSDSH